MGCRRIDDDPERRLLQPEFENDLLVLRMDGHGVAHPAVPQDLLAALAALPPVPDYVIRKDRTELLDRQWKVTADALERGEQDPGAARDADTALVGNVRGGLADQRRVRQPLRRDELPRHRLHVRLVHE